MAEIELHPEALVEYQDALAWYQARSPRAVDRFEAETERVLESIAANPRMFPMCGENHRLAMLRRFPFSIIYEERPGSIFVVAIAHSRRPPGFWQRRI